MTGGEFCGLADLLNLGLLVLRGLSFISPFTFTGLVVFALAPVLLYRPGRNPPLNRYFGRSVIAVFVHYGRMGYHDDEDWHDTLRIVSRM